MQNMMWYIVEWILIITRIWKFISKSIFLAYIILDPYLYDKTIRSVVRFYFLQEANFMVLDSFMTNILKNLFKSGTQVSFYFQHNYLRRGTRESHIYFFFFGS